MAVAPSSASRFDQPAPQNDPAVAANTTFSALVYKEISNTPYDTIKESCNGGGCQRSARSSGPMQGFPILRNLLGLSDRRSEKYNADPEDGEDDKGAGAPPRGYGDDLDIDDSDEEETDDDEDKPDEDPEQNLQGNVKLANMMATSGFGRFSAYAGMFKSLLGGGMNSSRMSRSGLLASNECCKGPQSRAASSASSDSKPNNVRVMTRGMGYNTPLSVLRPGNGHFFT